MIKARNKRLLCQYMAFQCRTCSGTEVIRQLGGLFTPPSRCNTANCRAHSNFKPLLSSPHTRTVDWQTIKIQELISDTQVQSGPRHLVLYFFLMYLCVKIKIERKWKSSKNLRL